MSATCVDINFSCSLANETPLSLDGRNVFASVPVVSQG
jgi:hypothetical protein